MMDIAGDRGGTAAQDQDAVAEVYGLIDVVGHERDRRIVSLVHSQELVLQ